MNEQNQEPKTREERAAENVEQFFAFKEKIQSDIFRPVKTGLPFYDQLLGGGPMAQTLTVLLAEEKAGKTIFMQQLAESIAAQHGRRVIYLNFEMAGEQLLARAISARIYKRGNMKLTAKQVLQGYKWTDEQRGEILEAVDEYEREALPYIAYNPKGIKQEVKAIEKYLDELAFVNCQAPILFVDYLQLIQGGNSQDIKDRLTQILFDLKKYAIKGNTLVYLISAVNRDSKKKYIDANSGRDTSAIEYQADYLLTLQNYKDQAVANRKGLQRMILKLERSRDDKSNTYCIIYRDGANNLFTGEYHESDEPDDDTEIMNI